MRLFRNYAVVIILIALFPTASFALSIGPYTGQVIDSRTGEPVIGASFLIYWIKKIPRPMGSTDLLLKVTLTYTDNEGRYHVPASKANLGLTAVLDSTHIVIYQPGYEVCILEVTHFDPYGWAKNPKNFKKTGNLVKLDRVPPHFDHKAHHKKITRALDGLDEYEYVYIGFLPTEKPRMTGPILEMREFLKRIEWEERRSLHEGR